MERDLHVVPERQPAAAVTDRFVQVRDDTLAMRECVGVGRREVGHAARSGGVRR